MAGKGTKNNQQNTQGDAQTEQAVQTKPLDFDVRIHSIKPNESIKGTASVNINGAFAIRGVKIIEGSNGLFVSMPSYKVGNEYKDICFPITQECRKQLNDAVIGAIRRSAFRRAKARHLVEHPKRHIEMVIHHLVFTDPLQRWHVVVFL